MKETIAPTQEEMMTELRYLALQKGQLINMIRSMQGNLESINERTVELYNLIKAAQKEEG